MPGQAPRPAGIPGRAPPLYAGVTAGLVGLPARAAGLGVANLLDVGDHAARLPA